MPEMRVNIGRIKLTAQLSILLKRFVLYQKEHAVELWKNEILRKREELYEALYLLVPVGGLELPTY